MEKNVCIVHFNTPELTRFTVLSLLKHTPDCKVTILDNSDSMPFVKMDGISVLDNTNGQLIDYERMISEHPGRANSYNDYGSAKHCRAVDYLLDLFDDGFLLLDSDVIVKRDVSPLFDSDVIWVGQPHISVKHRINIPRLYPFCCFINTRMCKKNGIRYFDGEHMWQLSDDVKGKWYDTGAWFLHATRKLPHRRINIFDYIVHYGGGSFRKNKKQTKNDWLRKYRMYYE